LFDVDVLHLVDVYLSSTNADAKNTSDEGVVSGTQQIGGVS
jgi:hypothetical protein